MSYTALITYPVYDLNATQFMSIVKDVLKAEFLNQRTVHGKTFLPKDIQLDSYLLNPISDKEIDPAFCSIIKAKMSNTDRRFADQQNDTNSYIIGILADGLDNLRKIADAIYEILNDMSIKNYLFTYKNTNGDNLISNSGEYYISGLSTEFEVSKTMNDKNIVYGYIVLNAEIDEVPKFNDTTLLSEVNTTIKLGENEISVNQDTTFEDIPATPITFILNTIVGEGGYILQSYSDEPISGGTLVPLVVIANEGYAIDEITVNSVLVTENPFIVTMDINTEVEVTFLEL